MFPIATMIKSHEARIFFPQSGPVTFIYKGQIINRPQMVDGELTSFYNIGNTMEVAGVRLCPVRVEPLGSECGDVYLGKIMDNGFVDLDDAPCFKNAQDPFFMKLGGKTFLSLNSFVPENGIPTQVRQAFYSTEHLERPFALGPLGQKGAKLVDNPNGGFDLIARRQEDGLRGQLTHTWIRDLSQLQEAIPAARLLKPITRPHMWVGANQLFNLGLSGRYIGIIGHVARFINTKFQGGKEKKQYFVMVAIYDRVKGQVTEMEILLDAANITGKEDVKIPGLDRTVYPGGAELISAASSLYLLNLGINDMWAAKVQLTISLFDRYKDL